MICMLMHLFSHHHGPQSPSGQPAPWSFRESPQKILDRRYASGEITREQYEESKQTLTAQRGNR